MNRALPILGGVLFAGLLVFAIMRMVGGGDSTLEVREASRLLVCEGCGAVSIVDPDFVRQSYEAGEIRPGPTPRFKCQACGELDARVEILNFTGNVVRCQECQDVLIDNNADAAKAVDAGDIQVGKGGELTFRCPSCGDFHGRMVEREAPMIEEQE